VELGFRLKGLVRCDCPGYGSLVLAWVVVWVLQNPNILKEKMKRFRYQLKISSRFIVSKKKKIINAIYNL